MLEILRVILLPSKLCKSKTADLTKIKKNDRIYALVVVILILSIPRIPYIPGLS